MKHLWIGVGNSEEEREKIIQNGGKLLSADVSNDALMVGLYSNGISCDSINSSRLPTYPAYKQKRILPYSWKKQDGGEGISVGYWNFPYINLLSKTRTLAKAAKKWAKRNKNEDVTVWVYQMHSPFMKAADAVKKIIPSAKIVLIVPDLPQYMDMNMSKLKKALKKIDWINIQRLMKNVDKYILYSKHMADFLKLQDGSWMVMEGSYDANILLDDNDDRERTDKISVMYSGVLDMRYGIPQLLDAMKLLDERYELWFTGNGNAVELINERAKTDSRIKNFGFLPSRLDLLKKQQEATMLISTRDPSEPASKYCFPSKIFEYMVSGNPVISTRIEGIPDEYFEYLIELPDLSPETISEKIRIVGNMSPEQLRDKGKSSRDFVLTQKNNVEQMKRILKFVL